MRSPIDIPAQHVKALDQLSLERGVSRAEIVRMAIGEYLGRHRAGLDLEAFGIWKDMTEDSVAYQRQLRSQWPTSPA